MTERSPRTRSPWGRVKARSHGSGVWAPEEDDGSAPLAVAGLAVPGFLAVDVLGRASFPARRSTCRPRSCHEACSCGGRSGRPGCRLLPKPAACGCIQIQSGARLGSLLAALLLFHQQLLLFHEHLLLPQHHLLFHDLLIEHHVAAGHSPFGRPSVIERSERTLHNTGSPALGLRGAGKKRKRKQTRQADKGRVLISWIVVLVPFRACQVSEDQTPTQKRCVEPKRGGQRMPLF